ncbi:MAG: hypothetical protein WCK98_03270 [bacterium]
MQHFTYELITFPEYIIEFKAKSKKEQTKTEAKKYFDWMMSIMPKRLEILIDTVKNDGISLDYSRESLEKLQSWFYDNIFPSENTKIDHDGKEYHDISFETYCLCLDISMYLNETIRRQAPDLLLWDFDRSSKNYADRHEPVIKGFTYKQEFPSETKVTSTARCFFHWNTKFEDFLTKQFDLWIKEIPEPGKEYILKGVDNDRQQKVPDSVLEQFGIKRDSKKK